MATPAAPRRLQITLLHERSSGTFAKVYLAEALGAGGIARLVAVKVLREKWAHSEEFLSRTRDEARMLAALRHPSIVRVEDLVELDGQLAIVMEFVNGVDVQQLMDSLRKSNERLPRRTAYAIIQKVASALDTAHRKTPFGYSQPIQVVHRDIKPSNMMLTPDGELKVLDFGTARGSFEDRSAKTTMFRFGSLKYMSPERRLGDRGDHAGDIYALGLVLIELLHGRWLGLLPEPPDHDTAVADAIEAIDDTGMPSDDWDAAVRKVIAQMCATEPEDRPDAEKVVKLMRAFADQADGPGFEAFCAESVEHLVKDLFPPNTQRTELRRFSIGGDGAVALEGTTGSGTLAGVSTTGHLHPPPEPPPLAPLPPRSEPTAVPEPETSSEPRPEAAPVVQAPVVQAPVVQAPVVQAPVVQAPVIAGPVAPVETPRVRPAAAPEEDLDGPSVAGQLPGLDPPEAPAPPSSRRTVLMVLGGAAVAGFGMVVAAGLTILLFTGGWDPAPGDPSAGGGPSAGTGAPEAPREDPAPPAGGTAVQVRSEDDLIQWIRLYNTRGEELVKGDRDGLQADLAPGEYELAVKLAGRGTARAPLTVGEEDLRLGCSPDKGGKVLCTDAAGKPITLEPE